MQVTTTNHSDQNTYIKIQNKMTDPHTIYEKTVTGEAIIYYPVL